MVNWSLLITLIIFKYISINPIRQKLSDCVQRQNPVDICKKLTFHSKAQIELKRISWIKVKDRKKRYIHIYIKNPEFILKLDKVDQDKKYYQG